MVWVRRAMVLVAAPLILLLSAVGAATAAGQAEMRVNAPTAPQSISTPFDVTVAITRADVSWAGYSMELAYDTSVLRVNSVTRAGIANCDDNSWGNPSTKPVVLTGCAFQTTQATGTTETINFQCLKDGRSELHLVTPSEDSEQPASLFAVDALNIPTDLVDAEVTCGAGGPLATVPIPTNPPQSAVDTAIAGGVQTVVPTDTATGTPEQAGTPGTASSPGAAQTDTPGNTGSTAAARTGTPARTSSPSAARTGTPTATAVAAGSSGGSSGRGWLIAGVIGAVVLAGLAAGGAVLWRRRSTP